MSSPASGAPQPRMLRALYARNFRVYVLGAFVSNVGTWMQRIGQDWLVLELTDNNGWAIGVTTALQFLPVLLFSPLAGALADRFPKRRLMQVTQVMMAAPSLALGILAVTGLAEVWTVFAIAFVFGIGAAVDTPARQSFVPELVDRGTVANAIALNSVSFNVARVIGPAVAGWMIAGLGAGAAAAGWVILINALTYVTTFIALQLVDPRGLVPMPRPAERQSLRTALRYVWSHKELVLVLVIGFFSGTFALNFQLTNALMATEVFGKGAGEFGLLGSTMAIGSFAGAVLATRRTGVTPRTVVVFALAFGVTLLVAAAMPSYESFALWIVLIGGSSMLMTTAGQACVQIFTDPAIRGRVTALYVMITMGGVPIGGVVLGWVAESFGARWTLLAGGGVVLLATVTAVLVFSARGAADAART